MIREGAESAARIKQASKEALLEWFKQSEQLDIARTHYKLRGRRFADFASRIGVDRASAYQLVKLGSTGRRSYPAVRRKAAITAGKPASTGMSSLLGRRIEGASAHANCGTRISA